MSKYLRQRFFSIGILTCLLLTGVSDGKGLFKPQQEMTKIVAGKDTVFKDENGNVITQQQFFEMIQEGIYKPQAIKDGEKVTAIQLVKMSADESKNSLERKAIESKVVAGAAAPRFKEQTLSGNTVSLEDLKGKVVVMNFWFIGCAPCVAEMPELNKIVAKYQNNPDIVFVAAAMDEKKDLEVFLKKHSFDYQIVPAAQAMIRSYGIGVYPTHIVIGKDGMILKRSQALNPTSLATLESDIQAALKK